MLKSIINIMIKINIWSTIAVFLLVVYYKHKHNVTYKQSVIELSKIYGQLSFIYSARIIDFLSKFNII